jgi:hypothetical protein
MNKAANKTLALLAGMALTGASFAQFGWSGECFNPDNDSPLSDDWGVTAVFNDLVGVALGISGDATYGGDGGPCYDPARTLDAAGRMAFFVGQTGSIQSNFDNFLSTSMGAPSEPAGDYTYTTITTGEVTEDNDEALAAELFGDGGIRISFNSASKRQQVTIWDGDGVTVTRETRVIGDAVRFDYEILNTSFTDPLRVGMRFGLSPWMRSTSPSPETGANQAFTLLGGLTSNPQISTDNFVGILAMDTRRPPRTGWKYRTTDALFPTKLEALFGQSVPYGIRLDNGPTDATPDANTVNMVKGGNHAFTLAGNGMNLNLFGDVTGNTGEDDVLIRDYSIIQQFASTVVAPRAVTNFIHYIRSPWSSADYLDPYTLVLDAPRLLEPSQTGLNGIAGNPFTIRAYIDNQYADIDREIALNDVVMELVLPAGLSLASGQNSFLRLDRVDPNEIRSLQWRVVSDGTTIGDLEYTVNVRSGVGPAKSLKGVIRVAGTPTMRLNAGPNMVTFPYVFTDTSLNQILQLQSGVDYLAYRWDATGQSYQAVSSPERGVGYWVVPNQNQGIVNLQGASGRISDMAQGGLITNLSRGWNMVGNPYNYPIKLADLLFVTEEDPARPVTWSEAVGNSRIEAGVAFYNGTGYSFLPDSSSLLLPGQGYWIRSNSFLPIRLSWPPVYTPGVSGLGRSDEATSWPQNDRAWRLQIAARSGSEQDVHNYVGFAADPAKARLGQMTEPPMAPSSSLRVAVKGEVDGMASSVTSRSTDMNWTLQVTSLEAGNVTLSWPNLGQVPRGMRLRLADPATGQNVNLRSTSSFTVNFTEPGTRELTVTADQTGSNRPVIGNVIVSGDSRSAGSSIAVTYSISADAVVSVRVLSGAGKEVYTLSRGRSVSAGENQAVWSLRDNANRAVAPGAYRMEITAETPSGERVRRIVPINVVR